MSEPDAGIYDAWNKGLRAARGEWVAFLGADDAYEPDALSAYGEQLEAGSAAELDFLSSRVALMGEAGRVLRVIGDPWNWRTFRRYMNVAHVGALHHRRLYERYGVYDTTYRICGDYELLLRAGPALRAGFLDRVTAIATVGGVSVSSTLALDEAMRAKVTSGGRSPLACQLERLDALVRYRVRRVLGYHG